MSIFCREHLNLCKIQFDSVGHTVDSGNVDEINTTVNRNSSPDTTSEHGDANNVYRWQSSDTIAENGDATHNQHSNSNNGDEIITSTDYDNSHSNNDSSGSHMDDNSHSNNNSSGSHMDDNSNSNNDGSGSIHRLHVAQQNIRL